MADDTERIVDRASGLTGGRGLMQVYIGSTGSGHPLMIITIQEGEAKAGVVFAERASVDAFIQILEAIKKVLPDAVPMAPAGGMTQ